MGILKLRWFMISFREKCGYLGWDNADRFLQHPALFRATEISPTIWYSGWTMWGLFQSATIFSQYRSISRVTKRNAVEHYYYCYAPSQLKHPLIVLGLHLFTCSNCKADFCIACCNCSLGPISSYSTRNTFTTNDQTWTRKKNLLMHIHLERHY